MQSSTTLSSTRIRLDSVLGESVNSRVFLAHDVVTNEALAVKQIDSSIHGSDPKREVQLLQRVGSHPNVTPLKGHFREGKKDYLVMPFLPYPTLKTYLEESGALSEAEALHVLSQILTAVDHMRRHNVAHRDIKTENLLIDPQTLHVYFIDFGLGSIIRDFTSASKSFVGTPSYMAPEILTRDRFYRIVSADLWSIGIVLLESLISVHPFIHARSLEHLMALQRKLRFDNWSPITRKILSILLHSSPTKRLHIFEMLSPSTEQPLAGDIATKLETFRLDRPLHRKTCASEHILPASPAGSVRVE